MNGESGRLELINKASRLTIRLFSGDQTIQPYFGHHRFLLVAVFGLPFTPSRRHTIQMQRFQLQRTINGHDVRSVTHHSDRNQLWVRLSASVAIQQTDPELWVWPLPSGGASR